MICLICRRAETIEALTTVVLERGELKIVINDVPAYICPYCGEPYVDEDVAIRLLQVAEHRSIAGKLDAVGEYDSFE